MNFRTLKRFLAFAATLAVLISLPDALSAEPSSCMSGLELTQRAHTRIERAAAITKNWWNLKLPLACRDLGRVRTEAVAAQDLLKTYRENFPARDTDRALDEAFNSLMAALSLERDCPTDRVAHETWISEVRADLRMIRALLEDRLLLPGNVAFALPASAPSTCTSREERDESWSEALKRLMDKPQCDQAEEVMTRGFARLGLRQDEWRSQYRAMRDLRALVCGGGKGGWSRKDAERARAIAIGLISEAR